MIERLCALRRHIVWTKFSSKVKKLFESVIVFVGSEDQIGQLFSSEKYLLKTNSIKTLVKIFVTRISGEYLEMIAMLYACILSGPRFHEWV